jgi:hypothetical protein
LNGLQIREEKNVKNKGSEKLRENIDNIRDIEKLKLKKGESVFFPC